MPKASVSTLPPTASQAPMASGSRKVVVIGPSGSGKSVLIRCINGLETPDFGSITG